MTGVREWWRRALTRNPAAVVPVRVVGRAALGAGHAVFVLEIEGQRLIVGIAPQQIAALGALPCAVEERAS